MGTSLQDAKLEHIYWGNALHQEMQLTTLKKKGATKEEIKALCEETEEVYRQLRRRCEESGLTREASQFFYKEMSFRRLALSLWSRQRFFSWCFDRLCGYGEKPGRLIGFSMIFIVICAIGHFFTGFYDGDTLIHYYTHTSLQTNFYQFLKSLYFSIVTFTTLGYGDITPTGIGRIISAIEAFIGSFTIALYVVVFVRRMAH